MAGPWQRYKGRYINVRKALKEYNARVAGLLKDDSKPLAEISTCVSKCGECHQPFVELKKIKHGALFSSLERAGKSDPECAARHTSR